MEEASFVEHQPCRNPECGSSNGMAVYDDGHGWCFVCEKYFPAGEDDPNHPPRRRRSVAQGLIDVGVSRALGKRSITQATCEKFGYTISTHKGQPVQVAPYHDHEGNLIAQHIRTAGKDFAWVGEAKDAGFFGQHLWKEGGKKVIITEGEIDCMSVSQLQGNKWPCVSLPNGAQGGKRTFKKELMWLEKFEQVVICFDMDEPGKKAAQECAALLTPGRARIVHLPLKDANDMLVAERGQELMSATWDAKEYRPDGIVSMEDILDNMLVKPTEGIPWPWPELTRLTYGRRPGEVYGFGAGTGIGKTDVFTQIIAQTAGVAGLNLPVGIIYLEQAPTETAKRIAGKIAKRRFHVPGAGWTNEELVATAQAMAASGNLHFYDHFGVCDWDIIRTHIRYLVHAKGVKHIFLDHLTALATGGDSERNEKEELERIMADISGMAQELGFTLYFISHLTTPEGKPHEEGGRVTIRNFKGSRAIGFWSHFMFGLERDQQNKDDVVRQTTTFRVLKDRFTGQATGQVFYMAYNIEEGTLYECAEPPKHSACPFKGEGDETKDF